MSEDLKDFPVLSTPQDIATVGTVEHKFIEHADDEPVLFKHLNENLGALVNIVKPQLDCLPYHATVLSLLMEKLGITDADVQNHRQQLVKRFNAAAARQFDPKAN